MASPPPTTQTLTWAWTKALQTMRAQKAPGLVFVLPAADAPFDPKTAEAAVAQFRGKGRAVTPVEVHDARDLLLVQIQLLRQGPMRRRDDDGVLRPAVAAAFGLAVPVVATAATCGATAGETIVVLGEDGRRIAGLKVDLADAAAVERALAPHLFDAKTLAARAANTPPAVQQALVSWRADGAATETAAQTRFAAALGTIQQQVHAAAPAIVADEPVDDQQVRGGMNAAIPSLAYLLQFTTPLGTEVAASWDPCPPCGMAAVPMPMRSALKLLAQ